MVNITGPKGRAFNSPARKGVAQRLVNTRERQRCGTKP